MNLEETKFYQSIIANPQIALTKEPSITLLSVIRENYKNENWNKTIEELKIIFKAVKHEHLKKLINYLLSHEKETKELLYKTKNDETIINIIINATSIKIKTTKDNKKYLEWIKELNNEIKNLYTSINAYKELIEENDPAQKDMRVQNLLKKDLSKDFKKQIITSLNPAVQTPKPVTPTKAVKPKKATTTTPAKQPPVIVNKNEQLLNKIMAIQNNNNNLMDYYFIDNSSNWGSYKDLYNLANDLIITNNEIKKKEFIEYLISQLGVKLIIKPTNRLGILLSALINNCQTILTKEFIINTTGINYLGCLLKKNKIKINKMDFNGDELSLMMEGGELKANNITTNDLGYEMKGGKINALKITCERMLKNAHKGLIKADEINDESLNTQEIDTIISKNVKIETKHLTNKNNDKITTKGINCKATIIVNGQELKNTTITTTPKTTTKSGLLWAQLKNKKIPSVFNIDLTTPNIDLTAIKKDTDCLLSSPIGINNKIRLLGAPIEITKDNEQQVSNLFQLKTNTQQTHLRYAPISGTNYNFVYIKLTNQLKKAFNNELAKIDNNLKINSKYMITILETNDLVKVTSSKPSINDFIIDYVDKIKNSLNP